MNIQARFCRAFSFTIHQTVVVEYKQAPKAATLQDFIYCFHKATD
jgi:hypothetical protein